MSHCGRKRLSQSPGRGRRVIIESLERRQFLDAAQPYHLTYDDEFNSLKLSNYNSSGNLVNSDPANSGYLTRDGYDTTGYDGTTGGPQQYYANPATDSYNPFSISNGILNISAQTTPKSGSGATPGDTQAPYVSGELTTAQGESYTPYNMSNGFSQTYGYFEMKCQIPSGAGLWPAFWLYTEPKATASTNTAEYDIFEIPQNAVASPTQTTLPTQTSRTVYQTSHYNSTFQESYYNFPAGQDAATAFHTYGFEWDANSINWYVDGVLTGTMPNVSNSPMYVLMDLAVGGSWPGSPTSSTVFPAGFQIDYLRIYSNLASAPAVTAQANYSVDADTLSAITLAPEPATVGAVLASLLYLAGRRPRQQIEIESGTCRRRSMATASTRPSLATWTTGGRARGRTCRWTP